MIICPLVFFAGLVDSIAGGGGIISLPAYYIAGIAPQTALGTNKFVSTFGTLTSSIKYIKSKKVHMQVAIVAFPAALAGSFAGARLAMLQSDVFLKYMLVVALPILAVLILLNKNFGSNSQREPLSPKKILLYSALSGCVIGGYDGFFGPGTGTFLILIFNSVIRMDLITASGTAKIVNLASNVAALLAFLQNDSIAFRIGIPAIIFSVAGNYVGSCIAIKKGANAIRPMFVLVFILLMIKIISDMF